MMTTLLQDAARRAGRVAAEQVARADRAVMGTRHLTRGAAVLRIGVGVIVLGQQLLYFPERHALWGAGAAWQSALLPGQGYNRAFDLFVDHPSGPVFELLYGAVAVGGLLLVLGWRTRWVLAATVFLHTSQWRVDPALWDGDFNLLRITMIYLLLVASADHWSLDARRRARRGTSGSSATWLVNLLHQCGLGLITLQISLVYVGSAMFKTQGDQWQHGTAMFTVLQLQEFTIWPELNALLLQHHVALGIVTYVTVFAQFFFPALLLRRWTRVPTLIVVSGMHLGIAVLMGLPFFSLTMIVIDLVFIRNATFEHAEALLRQGVALVRERRAAGAATPVSAFPPGVSLPRPRVIDLRQGPTTTQDDAAVVAAPAGSAPPE